MNPGNMHDNMQISACYDSQFRRSLMECLEKPYDEEEYDRRMLEMSKRLLKERHVETRQGVVKSYHSKGVCKSHLDQYPGRFIFSQVSSILPIFRFSSFI
jgi:hypothetical protein